MVYGKFIQSFIIIITINTINIILCRFNAGFCEYFFLLNLFCAIGTGFFFVVLVVLELAL